MATSILDIIIKMTKEGGADKDTVRGLVEIKSNVMGAIATFTAFAAAGAVLERSLQEVVNTFVDYALQVEDLSRVTGTSMEESSRMIQLADDLRISYDSLQRSLWFASKSGVEVNIESLARLADQYVGFGSATDKATFLAKTFGKAGEDMGKMLSKGGDGVRALSAAIEPSLVLTEEAAKKADDYTIAVDNLGDAWTAFTINLGQAVVPPLTDFFNGLNDISTAIENVTASGRNWNNMNLQERSAAIAVAAAAREKVTALKESTRAQKEDTISAEEALIAAKKLNDELKNQLSTVKSVQSEMDSYSSAVRKAQDNMVQLGNELDDAKKKYGPHSQAVIDATKKYEEAQQAVEDLAAAHKKAMQSIIYDLYVAMLSVDGLTQAEYDLAIQAGVALGQLTPDAAFIATAMRKIGEAVLASGKTFKSFQTVTDSVLNGTIKDVHGLDKALEEVTSPRFVIINADTAQADDQLRRILAAEDALYDKTITITTDYRETGQSPGSGEVFVPRYASGADFLVPAGFPNDSFPMQVQSGEHVKVTRAGQPGNQQGGGDHSKRTQIFGPVTIHVQNGQTIDDVLNQLR